MSPIEIAREVIKAYNRAGDGPLTEAVEIVAGALREADAAGYERGCEEVHDAWATDGKQMEREERLAGRKDAQDLLRAHMDHEPRAGNDHGPLGCLPMILVEIERLPGGIFSEPAPVHLQREGGE